MGPGWPRWACSACPTARTTAAWAPARSSWPSWPRSSVASTPPSRTSTPSCWPAASSPPSARAEQKAEVLGAISSGEKLVAAALLEPGTRWDLAGEGVVEKDGRLTGVKEPVVAGGRADLFVVSAATDAGPALFLVDARRGRRGLVVRHLRRRSRRPRHPRRRPGHPPRRRLGRHPRPRSSASWPRPRSPTATRPWG